MTKNEKRYFERRGERLVRLANAIENMAPDSIDDGFGTAGLLTAARTVKNLGHKYLDRAKRVETGGAP